MLPVILPLLWVPGDGYYQPSQLVAGLLPPQPQCWVHARRCVLLGGVHSGEAHRSRWVHHSSWSQFHCISAASVPFCWLNHFWRDLQSTLNDQCVISVALKGKGVTYMDTASQKSGLACFFFILMTLYAVDTHWRCQIYDQDVCVHVAKQNNVE